MFTNNGSVERFLGISFMVLPICLIMGLMLLCISLYDLNSVGNYLYIQLLKFLLAMSIMMLFMQQHFVALKLLFFSEL